jgi:hypothetical protein
MAAGELCSMTRSKMNGTARLGLRVARSCETRAQTGPRLLIGSLGISYAENPAHIRIRWWGFPPCHTRFSKKQNQANHMCAQEVHRYARMKKYQKQCYYITYT